MTTPRSDTSIVHGNAPISEIDQLKQQNSLLLRRVLTLTRECNELKKQLAERSQ